MTQEVGSPTYDEVIRVLEAAQTNGGHPLAVAITGFTLLRIANGDQSQAVQVTLYDGTQGRCFIEELLTALHDKNREVIMCGEHRHQRVRLGDIKEIRGKR